METLETTERKPSFLGRKPRHIYGDQLLFLLVLLGMAVLKSGTRSLGLVVFAVLTSIIVDVLCCYFTRKVYNPRDLSTITSGMCLALMSPATLPFSLVIFGAAMAIGVKHIFGGKDNYIFNPTAVAFAFLIICYPVDMLLFPSHGEILPFFGEVPIPIYVGLENFLLRRGAFPTLSGLDMLLGNFPGPIGTTHVLIIVISALCLLLRRSVSAVVTISCLSVITISRLLFPLYDDVIGALSRELFGGYLLFALLFLANDPQTLPKTVFGRLYYGVFLGVLTVVFRGSADGIFSGRVEGWFIFALLIANAFSCRMDIISARVSDTVAFLAASLKEKLSAYERFSEDVQSGATFDGDITATMEIDLTLSNYDMPPIDNKVIKINRKKRNVLTYVIEFYGSLREKAKRNKNDGASALDYVDSDELKTSFVADSFKALFDTVKTPFVKAPDEPDEISESVRDGVPDVPFDDTKTHEPKSNIKITDFKEIKETVAEVEAIMEAEFEAEEARKAEEAARLAAEEAARIAAEEARIAEEVEAAAKAAAEEAARIAEEEAKAAAKAVAEAEKEAAKAAAKAAAEAEKEAAKAAKEAAKAARLLAAELAAEAAKNAESVGNGVPDVPSAPPQNEETSEKSENKPTEGTL